MIDKRNVPEPSTSINPAGEGRTWFAEREIVFPHAAATGPVTAVKNVLIQASLAELKAKGHYERYTKLIAPGLLDQLLSSLAPAWIPVKLVLAHYQACENLMLSREDFEAMGDGVGDRVQDTVLISAAKKVREADFDLWSAIGSLQRMWPRIYQGGSVQVVRVGPKELLLEQLGFVLNRYQYFRQGQLAALRATYGALGARLAYAKVVSYNAGRDEMVVHVAWF